MEEESNEDYGQLIDESRRSFMKKGALASGALALGVGGSGTAASESSLLQDADEALVFTYDYRSGVTFEVISRLQQSTVDDMLGREVDGDEIISDPDDYRGYIILYTTNGNDPGEYAFVFIEDESLSEGDEYEFGTDAVFFSTEANLLEVDIDS